MKLISVNIEVNKHPETVLNFLKKEKADVVCFQELLEEEFEFYKKELNLNGIFQAFDYCKHYIDLKVTYDINPELKGKKHGIAIFAKNIIDSGSIFYKGNEENVLKSFDEFVLDERLKNNNAFVWAQVKDDDDIIFKFITTQLPVTHKGEVTPYQLEVIDALLLKLKNIGEFILCGDMNAPRGKKSFSLISEKYKDNIPLKYKTSIDQNLHRVKGIQFMVDCLFTTPIYKASNVKLIDGVSDHMAVIADINRM